MTNAYAGVDKESMALCKKVYQAEQVRLAELKDIKD